jgi:mono/diheme cytochrome c family protein
MFRGECMSCHTLDGYRPMRELVKGRDRKNVMNLLGLLHSPTADSPYRAYMPPLVGTQPEIQALADYLISLNPPEPHKAPATAPQEAPTSAPKKAPGPAAVAVLPKG